MIKITAQNNTEFGAGSAVERIPHQNTVDVNQTFITEILGSFILIDACCSQQIQEAAAGCSVQGDRFIMDQDILWQCLGGIQHTLIVHNV